MTAIPLLDLLEARDGVVALVGAGGKKTTLYRLAAEHAGPVAVTTMVRMAPFPAGFEGVRIVDERAGLLKRVPQAAARQRCVAYAMPEDRPGRLSGVSPELVARLHRQGGFRATLTKADGARTRWLKCPRAEEPRLPQEVTTVVPLVSARAFGCPLDDRIAHHPEACADELGLAEGRELLADDVAALMSDLARRCHVHEEVRVVPVINMVDDPELERAARAVAVRLLDREPTIKRVVLGAMNRPEPRVGVVER